MAPRKVHLSRENVPGMKKAVLILYVRTRRTEVLQCHKCLGYDHRRREYSGVDRSKTPFICGQDGHFLKECDWAASCFLCRERPGEGMHEHIARSFERQVPMETAKKRKSEQASPGVVNARWRQTDEEEVM